MGRFVVRLCCVNYNASKWVYSVMKSISIEGIQFMQNKIEFWKACSKWEEPEEEFVLQKCLRYSDMCIVGLFVFRKPLHRASCV